ncbi:hypothetical protein B0H66DRAFT_536126 [Apodospora peruviana]|uniref:DUF726-domain-containing protein n=1 Tax=Apodospora peruviana TaxID=516989 RepID=A0AAE0M142_9PEZI|nr:hypothetical protein B0H66DRAFT_536126 [Apodospora peruviana]
MEVLKEMGRPLDPKDPTSPVEPASPTSQHSPTSPDLNCAEMAPGGKQRPNTPKREVDFSTVLTPSEKGELTALVNKATDYIQKQIIQVFDSTGINDTPGPARVSFWSKLPSHLRDLSMSQPQSPGQNRPNTKATAAQKENINPSRPTTGSSSGSVPSGVEAVPGDAIDQEEDALSTPRLQELKKEALQHFKKWQLAVIKRVGDISVKKNADGQNQAGSASGSKRGPSNNNRNRTSAPRAPPSETPDLSLMQHYPPIPTTLSSLPLEKRTLLLHALLLMLLSLEHYSAYSRLLLLHIASSLRLPLRALAEDEVRVAKSLAQLAKDIPTDEVIQKKSEEGKNSRRWKVGLAGIAGAAVIGITGGLAAPLVAAGLGTVLGGIGLGGSVAAGLLGTLAESSLVVGSLFGIYGARASGKAMEQYAKDVDDFAFLPLRGSTGEDSEIGKIETNSRRLRVVLAISGWLNDETDVTNPWRALGRQSEVYAVRWETESLLKMGTALDTVLRSTAWSMAKKEIIARTSEPSSKRSRFKVSKTTNKAPVFASLFEALWPIGLLRISKIIDNPWSVGMVRADKAGVVLADIIMNKGQGERGVTLIGFSLGARVIYTCLMTLAERRVFGLVENVVMMGTPAPSGAHAWCAMKSVVAGRLVNVYSENDYILAFLYRTSSIQYGVAGLERIEGIDGVENVDVSAKVSGHLRYRFLVGSILQHIGWEDIDPGQVNLDELALAQMEEKNREREKKRDAVELASENKKLEEEVAKEKKNEQEAIRTRARKNRGKK